MTLGMLLLLTLAAPDDEVITAEVAAAAQQQQVMFVDENFDQWIFPGAQQRGARPPALADANQPAADGDRSRLPTL